ncbi:MAG: hypothetical protein M3P08_17885 [Thermoproteota archaeon]|nr:hypothetical protein [Thermoproteota archaeon]
MTQATKQRGPTVAITGAGSGLGRELALGFSAKGIMYIRENASKRIIKSIGILSIYVMRS